jgi:DNA-directed RNA polymerase subunit RPC12/RpoP
VSMVIVCEGCGARFQMNRALFQDAKGARIRCRRCGGHIEVRHTEASPVPPAPEVPGADRYEPSPTAVPAIREAVPMEGPSTAPVFSTGIPYLHEPSSDAAAPPAKPEPEMESPVEARSDIPAPEPVDTVPEEKPVHAQPAPPLVTVHPPDPPNAAPAGEPETAMPQPGHLGGRDTRLEDLFLRPMVTDKAPEPDSPREEDAAEAASLKRRPRASHRRGPSVLTLFLLVGTGILLLAGGAFHFRDTKSAQVLLRRFFPPSGSENTARAMSDVSVVEKPAYEIRDMKSSYAKTFVGGNLFVIRGTVANVGKCPSRGIRVQATLLGKDDEALASNTVFAANLVDSTTLRHANRALVEGFLSVRYGEGNANQDVPAGKSLPFMVVFFDPPGQVESFTLKALDAE